MSKDIEITDCHQCKFFVKQNKEDMISMIRVMHWTQNYCFRNKGRDPKVIEDTRKPCGFGKHRMSHESEGAKITKAIIDINSKIDANDEDEFVNHEHDIRNEFMGLQLRIHLGAGQTWQMIMNNHLYAKLAMRLIEKGILDG